MAHIQQLGHLNNRYPKVLQELENSDADVLPKDLNKFILLFLMDENGNINCIDCKGCFNCTNCINCKGCFNCTNCIDCTRCTECTECSLCKGCNQLHNCENCYECLNCHGCKVCFESEGLENVEDRCG